MININDKLKALRTGDGTKRARTKETSRIGKTRSFTDHLVQQVDEVSRPSLNEELNFIRQALEDAGNTLERNPTIGNLEIYRVLLSNLVGKATQGAYEVEGVGPGWSLTDKHHVIRRIDEEVEGLLLLVLDEQKDALKIAAKLTHLKGLVVDLLY
ncbi:DUF327 family protein [Oceanospirillum maris]|jgi:uncharacterized protein YaaR (DUF327 family)|uniref:DUF327 family protein n=1 Tax=Oceanospirillum maris TaxID=64977 RepID=UPI000412BF17|nr:DUF327 family protein [Oceanospirillum maris]